MDLLKLAGCSDKYFSKLFADLRKMVQVGMMHGDSQPFYRLSSQQVDDLRSLQWEECKSRIVQFRSPKEAWDEAVLRVGSVRMLGDAAINDAQLYQGGPIKNPVYRYGTLFDPTTFTIASAPVAFGPMEASNVYANGGLPADIINKKSRAMVLEGATFQPVDKEFWNGDKLQKLEDAADATGFNDVAADNITEAFLYGGSIMYPIFKGDTPSRFMRPLDKLNLEKECIERWVTVDRWNVVTVPSFIVTTEDYINPKSMFIPMVSLEVNTSRICITRPKSLPYWALLYNIGWTPSDLQGWIRAYYAYEVTQMSVPVMAQQMSLLLYRMPLDGLNATIGPDNVEKLMAINEKRMAEWNSLNPKAVNMVGEVEVVDRTYSGFDQFVGAVKSELAVQTGLPEPSLFHTPNKGFSDNTTESLLKSSESLKISQRIIEKAMDPARDALVAHVFGTNSKEWENRCKVKLRFNKPVISTERDLADVGARFAASVNSFVQAGISPDVAIALSKPFFPSVKITDEMIKKAKESYDKQMEMGIQVGGGTSGGQIGSGQSMQTGHNTKAQSAKVDK